MKIKLLLLFVLLQPMNLLAQDDLLKMLETETEDKPIPVIQTFKGSRIVNGHSVETRRNGELEFLIMHRFGRINSGAYNFFGLDNAFIRLGLEYGISDRIGIGIGRSSFDKSFDGYFKGKVLKQELDGIPVSLTVLSSITVKTSPRKEDMPEILFNDRLAYTTQLLIARKINSNFSLQLMPSFVHRNTVDQQTEDNSLIAMGIGARHKITRSLALTAEYYYRVNPNENSIYTNPIAIGIDIETGGHVFQLHFTNAWGMIERAIITETSGDYFKGDINFGFNISRTFQLKKPESTKAW